MLLLPTHIAQLPADQTLRSFQFAWRKILIDNELSEEDIFDVGKHSDVSTLIEALKKRHPEHSNIKAIEVALLGKLHNETCARDKSHPMPRVLVTLSGFGVL